jgi:hypothetical protein
MKTIDEKIKNNVSRNLFRKQETAKKPTFFIIAIPQIAGVAISFHLSLRGLTKSTRGNL